MSGYPGQGQPAGSQQPPPGGSQYPPSTTAQYPPPASGQYPPSTTGGQYPPSAGGQYPPPAGGQYPPPAGGQYPPMAADQPAGGGQYPPPTYPQGQYPPSSYPPGGAPGQPQMYPPPAQPGFGPQQYPPAGPHGGPGIGSAYPPAHSGTGHQGGDLDDSDPEYDIRSKHNQKPVTVRFVNKTGKKVNLQWINHEGEFEKCRKIKEGKAEVLNTHEGHAFVVDGKKKKSKHVINQNRVFFVRSHPGQSEVVAEIKKGGEKKTGIKSTNGGRPVRVKFCNRSRSTAVINWVDNNGASKVVKELATKKCWFTDSSEGHCFTAHHTGQKGEHLDLNYSDHYMPVHGGEYDKVIITEGRRRSHSSSSSSDSS